MVRKLRYMKQHIVVLLLVGFTSAFVCDALCDLGVISWDNYAAVQRLNNHSLHEPDDHHADTEKHHHTNDEEACCDEAINNLYSSLIKQELKPNLLQIPIHYLLWPVVGLNDRAAIFSRKACSFFYTNLPPPLSGSHIRIFIQSFRN